MKVNFPDNMHSELLAEAKANNTYIPKLVVQILEEHFDNTSIMEKKEECQKKQ